MYFNYACTSGRDDSLKSTPHTWHGRHLEVKLHFIIYVTVVIAIATATTTLATLLLCDNYVFYISRTVLSTVLIFAAGLYSFIVCNMSDSSARVLLYSFKDMERFVSPHIHRQ